MNSLRGKPEENFYQIVGLVGDTKYRDMREAFQRIIFLAQGQDAAPDSDSTFVIRSGENTASLIAALKEVAARTNPEIVLNFGVLRTEVFRGLSRERLMAPLSGFYGALPTILAMVGLYGNISYTVIRRRNGIGIRMAMGADKTSILRMILGEVMGLLGAELAIGNRVGAGRSGTGDAVRDQIELCSEYGVGDRSVGAGGGFAGGVSASAHKVDRSDVYNRSLFVAKRNDRIHRHCAPCGNRTSDQRHKP